MQGEGDGMERFDVVVLGSGAAGLTAAIAAAEAGATVGLFEKSDKVGGTSAWSGGQIWIPNNPHGKAAGKVDSREDALAYFDALSNDLISRELATSYVDTGPEMIAFLEERTPVEFYAVQDFPDYHPELPGGKPEGGRTLECPPYPYGELGAWKDRVEVSPYFPDIHIAVGETTLGQAIPIAVPTEVKQRRVAQDERGLGHALVGRLLRGCLDRGIEPKTGWRAVDLRLKDGRVTGVVFETADGKQEVACDKVVIATGGFEWNDSFVRSFLRGPMTHPVSVKTNTGDGLKMAMKAGAMLGNMREAWWCPVIVVPDDLVSTGRQLMSAPRGLPGTIIVNARGKRFINEAANYNAAGAVFHEQDTKTSGYRNLPCWIIFNQTFYDRYGFAGGLREGYAAGQRAPDWITHGETLAELADKLGIPGDALAGTVERFNTYAREERDPDFHRGESAHDRWWGDPRFKGTPAATLGPMEGGPYYAVELKSGALGTKGGPQTDGDARVLDLDGQPIEGLYAAGNAMASAFGMTYGGAGGTLGPAMVFGYRAGRHAARHNATR
jgi:succinate dehydrogenase/fumarate reductase flavoprotein subunit